MMNEGTFKVARCDKGTGHKRLIVAEFATADEAENFIRGQFDYHGQDNGKLFGVIRPNGREYVPACAISIRAMAGIHRACRSIANPCGTRRRGRK